MTLAEYHTFGHLVPYTVDWCKKNGCRQDGTEFWEILGYDPASLKEIYSLNKNKDYRQELIIPRPPILSLITHICRNLWSNSNYLTLTIKAILIILRSLFQQLLSNKTADHLNVKSKKQYLWKSVSEKNFSKRSLKNRYGSHHL